MRAFFATSLLFVVGFCFSQNFVSPGIIAYHSGAFERTIRDMNNAFESGSDMDAATRAKAHYYRGMARLKLIRSGSNAAIIGQNPYLSIHNDLSRAMQLDSKWRSSAQSEISTIYNSLFSSAENLYEKGIYANTEEELNKYFEPALLQLNAAIKIRNNFDVNDLLGKVYDAMGVFYDQLVDDQEARQKSLSSYESAVEYYEASIAINPKSLENIRALKQLAYRLGDRDKELKYAEMEANLGG